MDILDTLRANLDALLAERAGVDELMEACLARPVTEDRTDLNDAEAAEFNELREQLEGIDARAAAVTARMDQITAARSASAAATQARAALAAQPPAPAPAGGATVTGEPPVYTKRGAHSFFADMLTRSNNPDAAERIARNSRQMEARAGTTASLNGLIPPQYLLDEFAPILRAGRITSNLVRRVPLPAVGTSFTLAKGATGLNVAAQNGENTALVNADYTTTPVTFNMGTFGGYTEMSRQEIDRNPFGDSIIMADLAAVYAQVMNTQVIAGSGAAGNLKGLLAATGTLAVAYTDGTPTVSEFWPKLADAIQQITAQRFLPADGIVMHPRRWAWLTSGLDTTGRPLVMAEGTKFDALADGGVANDIGPTPVGRIQGLPVYIDPGVPTNLGAGTNEDRVLVARWSDPILMEDEGVVPYRVYEEPGSTTLTIRLVVAGYAAFTAERYAQAVAIIAGTGLTPPTF